MYNTTGLNDCPAKGDVEIGGARWLGRPPPLSASELLCLAVAQAFPGYGSVTEAFDGACVVRDCPPGQEASANQTPVWASSASTAGSGAGRWTALMELVMTGATSGRTRTPGRERPTTLSGTSAMHRPEAT